MKLTKKEKERYNILSHMSNISKTDEEFEEYSKLTKKLGKPKPSRNYSKRALHEH